MGYQINERIRIILTKKITDKLTDEEEIEFNEYISSSEIVRHYYRELKKVWHLTGIFVFEKKYDVQISLEWKRFNDKLKLKNKKLGSDCSKQKESNTEI